MAPSDDLTVELKLTNPTYIPRASKTEFALLLPYTIYTMYDLSMEIRVCDV